jgi:class 3 adenylate cyclase
MSAGTEQRKLAAIMFTDMVGYSALSQRGRGARAGVAQTNHICAMILSPNSEHLISVAPSMSRAKS